MIFQVISLALNTCKQQDRMSLKILPSEYHFLLHGLEISCNAFVSMGRSLKAEGMHKHLTQQSMIPSFSISDVCIYFAKQHIKTSTTVIYVHENKIYFHVLGLKMYSEHIRQSKINELPYAICNLRSLLFIAMSTQDKQLLNLYLTGQDKWELVSLCLGVI